MRRPLCVREAAHMSNVIHGVERGPTSFDLARLSKSKQAVDLAPNTIREYARQGLNIYRMGKAAFFSKAELEAFIRAKAITGRVMPGTVRDPVMG